MTSESDSSTGLVQIHRRLPAITGAWMSDARHTGPMASIQIDDLTVEHGQRPVLTGVDLRIADGEAIAILGSSGSGKSTLLRAVAGLVDVTGGRILLDGEDLRGVRTRDRDMSMLFQGAWLQPHLSVIGNMEFPLRLRKTPREERDRRISAELRAFALRALGSRRPRTLSSGERHMAATAQSVVRVPRVLLLDEPVAQVDVINRVEVLKQIDEVRRGYGCTMLVATNDRRVAASLGDRTAVIERGQVVQAAPFQVLWAEPATIGVADLVGEWTLVRLHAQVSSIPGGRARLSTPAGTLQTWNRELAGRTSIHVGIRPEELRVVAPADAELRGVVQRVAPLGAQALLHVSGPGPEAVAMEAMCPLPWPEVGAEVGLRPIAFHLFDDDGRAVAHIRRPA